MPVHSNLIVPPQPILTGSVNGAPAIHTIETAAAPPASSAAPAPAAGSGVGACRSWAELQYKTYASPLAASIRHFVVSDSPRLGYYWAVLFLDALDTDTNAQALNFFLFTPNFAIPSSNGLHTDIYWQFEDISSGVIQISPGESGSAASLTGQSSQRWSVAPTGGNKIVVPSGWRVGAIEGNGTVSGVVHNLIMRIAFLELANGEQVPNL